MRTENVDNTDQLTIQVPYDRFHKRTETIKKNQDQMELINEGLKNLENFLTFLYEETEDFGKARDEFNMKQDECKILRKNGKIKIKLLGHETS